MAGLVFRWLNWLVVPAALLLSLATMTAQAAPVTFGFQADITEITPSSDAAFSLPSEMIVGATLTGSLTFEPPQIFGANSEGAALYISSNSLSFIVDQRSLVTENDLGIVVGSSIAVMDRILFQCGTTSDCASPIHATSQLEVNALSLAFIGAHDTIDPFTDFPGDLEAWNRLPTRRLFLLFSSPLATGSILLNAEVGPVYLVPEPSPVGLMISVALSSCCLLRPLRSRRRISLVSSTSHCEGVQQCSQGGSSDEGIKKE